MSHNIFVSLNLTASGLSPKGHVLYQILTNDLPYLSIINFSSATWVD
jgi:hypothetical protein